MKEQNSSFLGVILKFATEPKRQWSTCEAIRQLPLESQITRTYTGEKFNFLKREGKQHKMKVGIEANFTGRIFTNLFSTKKKKKKRKKKKNKKEKQDDEGDLFLLDY